MPSVPRPQLDLVALNNLIVVGASAGGIETISLLLSLMGPPLAAAMVVVVHISPRSSGVLPAIFGRRTRLAVKRAEHGDQLTDGFVYVAPPDHHVLVRDSRIEIDHGARENGHRPSIDALFRSAALACGSRAIGVVLSGFLDDGAAGLVAIQRQGGVVVVQEPEEAMFPAMPQNALHRVRVDHRVGIAAMGPLLSRLAEAPRGSGNGVMDAPASARLPERDCLLGETHDAPLAGGGSRVGRAISARSISNGQTAALERSLCASLRLLEERAKILDKMAADERRHGRDAAAAAYAERSAESQQHAREIRTLLGGKDVS